MAQMMQATVTNGKQPKIRLSRMIEALLSQALSRWLRTCDLLGGSIARWMKNIDYDGYRFPPAIIQQAIWLYFRFHFELSRR
jgi:hypothetical protein